MDIRVSLKSIFIRGFFIVLLIFLFLPSFCYGATESPPDTVTLGNSPGQYPSLSEALEAVADGGTIEIPYRKENYLLSQTIITKNVSIIGVPDYYGNLPTIIFSSDKTYPCLVIDAPEYVEIRSLILKRSGMVSSSETIIENYTPQLTIDNIITEYAKPIVMKSPQEANDSPLNIKITDSIFAYAPFIEFDSPVTGSVLFTGNTFDSITISITNNGADISIHDNTFNSSGVDVTTNSVGAIDIENNIFKGYRTKIISYSSSGLTIAYNSIDAQYIYLENYDEHNILDLENNWWGSINGLYGIYNRIISIGGNGELDYSNWALDEENTIFLDTSIPPTEVFVDTSYTITDSGSHVWGYEVFNNIDDAIAAVSQGGKVFINSGEYTGSLAINKGLTLSGLSSEKPKILGNNSDYVINITADNVVLNNLTLDGKNSAFNGLNASAVDSLTLMDISITNTQFTSINIDGVSGEILIDGCDINGVSTNDGIYIRTSGSGNIDIYDCSFADLNRAIFLEEAYASNNVNTNIGNSTSPNSFTNTSNYIYLQSFNNDIDALGNNWTLDGIEDKLFHNFDDSSLGRVKYLPEAGISGYASLKNSHNHEGITVELIESDSVVDSRLTDSTGFYEFENLEPNVYTLSFTYESFNPLTKDITLSTSNVEVNVELIYNFNLMDLDEDGLVSSKDLQLITNSFGSKVGEPSWNPDYDLNRNDEIDIMDLMILFRYKEG